MGHAAAKFNVYAHVTQTILAELEKGTVPWQRGWTGSSNDLLDLADDHPTATNFAKKKKGEKAEALDSLFNDQTFRDTHAVSAEQSAKIAAWLPSGMQ